MEIRLDGRTAIVTGGSKGIGFGIAKRFAESGADVAILARGAEDMARAEATIAQTARGRVRSFTCDVSDGVSIAAAFGQVMAAFGKVDIIVNNAGQTSKGTLEEITDEMWLADYSSKLLAVARFCRLAWPQMKERRWGRVINVLSIRSKTPDAGTSPTAVTRAAGLAFTKILSKEGTPHNILVNALLVGKIVTNQIAKRQKEDGPSLEEMIAAVGATVPLGRMGRPEEFANAACFLASDQASYISGTALAIDGGLSPVL